MPPQPERRALREQYLALLGQYGLEPRKIEVAFGDLLEYAVCTGDDGAAEECRELLRRIDPLDPPPHPAQLMLDQAAEWIEGAIHSSGRHVDCPHAVYVSEFPVGSVNALSAPAEGGFLVLVNSGLLVLVKQMLQGICLGGSLADDAVKTEVVVSTLAAVLGAYLEFGDPLYGPTPIASGRLALMSETLASNCQRFAVGHEYGHILLGHFDAAPTRLVLTMVGDVSAMEKSWEQEYEADNEAYLLLLESLHEVDDKSAPIKERVARLVEWQSAVAAPFVALSLFELVEEAMTRFNKPSKKQGLSHPPCRERQRRLAKKRLLDYPESDRLMLSYAEAIWAVSEEAIDRALRLTHEEFKRLVGAFDEEVSETGLAKVHETLDGLKREFLGARDDGGNEDEQ